MMSHLFNQSKQVKPKDQKYNHHHSLNMWTGEMITIDWVDEATQIDHYSEYEQIFLDDECLSLNDVDVQQNGLTRKQKESFIGIELELPSCIFQKLFEEEKEEEIRQDKKELAEFFNEFMKYENYDRFINLVSISKSYDEIINTHVQNIWEYEWSDSCEEQMMIEHEIALLPEVRNYYDDEYDMMANYDMMNEMNSNNIIKGMSQIFVDVLVDTYPDDTKIVKQFMLDFPRNTVYVNNKLVESLEKFLEVLSPFNRDHVIFNENGNRKRVINIVPFIMTFVCQSSFYPSYIHLFNKLQKMKDNEPWNNNLNNIHVTNTKDRNIIEINVTEEKIQCALISSFKLIDIRSDVNTLYNIKTETLFDSDMDNYLIVYKTYK